MKELHITKVLELSTAHISEETNGLIEQDVLGIVAYEKAEYGWLLLVPQDDYEEETRSLPDDLKAIFDLAQEHDCVWVMLDRDGYMYDSLPVFDW
ncbi:hypothetical protein [Brevibacillus brevis]|uniref:DUF5983 domain-containing protein n=1 Tax=Brevibacillus brevis TaxID=1393 RepID=A0ABY9TG01_BREBE|nr:hypothetical protein [Brevibacillus brevis]WNC17938.1 hypothetical protein RGB73_30245 [Brevibacillus brevis]